MYKPNHVLVDCFFYYFFLHESKVTLYFGTTKLGEKKRKMITETLKMIPETKHEIKPETPVGMKRVHTTYAIMDRCIERSGRG